MYNIHIHAKCIIYVIVYTYITVQTYMYLHVSLYIIQGEPRPNLITLGVSRCLQSLTNNLSR